MEKLIISEWLDRYNDKLKGSILYYSNKTINVCAEIEEVRNIALRSERGAKYLIVCKDNNISCVLEDTTLMIEEKNDETGWRFNMHDFMCESDRYIVKKH